MDFFYKPYNKRQIARKFMKFDIDENIHTLQIIKQAL